MQATSDCKRFVRDFNALIAISQVKKNGYTLIDKIGESLGEKLEEIINKKKFIVVVNCPYKEKSKGETVVDNFTEPLKFTLEFNVGGNYPFSPPDVKFLTKSFHPNIDTSGTICVDILKERWSAVQTFETVILSIVTLLNDPNCDSPLNQEASREYQENRAKYYEKATQALRTNDETLKQYKKK